ncbi:MAG: LemA family protein [Ideonella sp.]|jgi:LemA protein|nr:LemA family protein [Ideonella sp.]MBL0150940.1 LemA family protein [Ideonella sp.]
MTGVPWPWLLAVAVIFFWMLGAYNRVMALRGALHSAWQQLDTVIQARQQAIGSLVDAVEPRMAAERSAIDAMVAAQVRVATAAEVVRRRPTTVEPVAVLAKAEGDLAAALARLQSLVEQQAELRHEPAVSSPTKDLVELAARMRFNRQGFNDAANAYNAAVTQFPTRLLVRVFRFELAGTL